MPILPFLKQEIKIEDKQGPAMDKTMEPVPGMSHEQSGVLEGAGPCRHPPK